MPEVFRITRSNDTPEVFLDPATGKFEMHYRSYPEDAAGFYTPILSWLADYTLTPQTETEFIFNLEYFNTASAKQIFKILMMLQELNNRSKVRVIWQHHKEDADMQAAGDRFSKLLSSVEFCIIAV
ncbi:MAG: DUF1987 domain-containing protein [Bacteroidia bacterium]|nr:DUF1987 domain-containing protein [Bacteroidia bacterium]